MPLCAQGADDLFFLVRCQAREDVTGLHLPGKVRFAQGGKLWARHDLRNHQPDIPANLLADQLVVAGQDFDRYPGARQRFERLLGALFGGIKKCDIAQQRQFRLVGHAKRLLGPVELAVRNRQHPVAIGAQVPVFVHQIIANQLDQRVDVFVHLVVFADAGNFFDRALTDQDVAVFIINDHRHPPPFEIKRNLVHFPAILLDVDIRVRQHGAIEQIAQSSLVMAVHVRVAENVLAGPARHIHVALQHDMILGQRPGLISA